MTREIIVTITAEGETKVEVKGHHGPGCKDLTRQLEAALGETTADRKTAEFSLAEQNRQQQRNRT